MKFDPLTFDTFHIGVDPIVADQRAITTLDALESREAQLAGKVGPPSPTFDRAKTEGEVVKLKDNLAAYRGYKVNRGEVPFSFAPEARSRTAAEDTERITRTIATLFTADDATFEAFVKDQGDEGRVRNYETAYGNKQAGRERYLTKKSMSMLFGFSAREIASGAVEPLVRQITGAKEGESEPTYGALKRWSLDKVNQFDRRDRIETAARDNAHASFMGMTDDKDDAAFDALIGETNLTDQERTMIRTIRNNVYQGMEENAGKIRPLVRKAFNTIAMQDSSVDKEKGTRFDDGTFATTDEMVQAFSELKPEEFEIVNAMLAETAKAHGRDVDGFMNGVANSLERSLDKTFGGFSRGAAAGLSSNVVKLVEGEAPLYVWSNIPVGDIGQLSTQLSGIDPRRSGNPLVANEESRWNPGVGKRRVTPMERETLKQQASHAQRVALYGSQLSNWRESVAKIDYGDWYSPKGFVYNLAGMIPEMAMSATPIGLPVVFGARQEQLRTNMRQQKGTAELTADEEEAIALASGIYAGLARTQMKTLFARMPGTNSLVGQWSQVFAYETVQELGQEGAAPVVQQLYHSMGADVQDVNLFTDGNLWDNLTKEGGELTNLIRESPRIMFTVAPLALLSVGGHAAGIKMDQQTLRKVLHDESLLYMVGLDRSEIADIQKLNAYQAADFLQKRYQDMGFTFRSEAELREAGIPLPDFPMSQADTETKVQLEMEAQLAALGVNVPAEVAIMDDNHRRVWAQKQAGEILEAAGVVVPEQGLDFLSYGDFANEAMRRVREEFGLDEASTPGNFASPEARMQWAQDNTSRPTIAIKEDGTFTVSKNGKSFNARTPEEVAEVARTLDPRYKPLSPKSNTVKESSVTVDPDSLRHSTLGLARMVSHEDQLLVREAMPPRADDPVTGSYSRGAKLRYGLQKFLGQRRTPGRTLDATRVKYERMRHGYEQMASRNALQLEKEVAKLVKKQAPALRQSYADNLTSDIRAAIHGDAKAMANLPTEIQPTAQAGRDFIDKFSQDIQPFMQKTLAQTLGDNIGSYMFRHYKVHDPKANWNETTVRRDHPQVYDDAMKYLQSTGLTKAEAEQSIKEMLHPSKAEDFLMGNSSAGRVDVTSLIKRKELAPEIRALLGEVTDPIAELRVTGKKVSDMALGYAAQADMASWLVKTGLAKRAKGGDFIKRIGDGPTGIEKAFRGFGEDFYTYPELAEALEDAFRSTPTDLTLPQVFARSVAAVSAFGKFNMVILNPGSYAVNYYGALSQEFIAGRLFNRKLDGAKAFLKFGTSILRDQTKSATYTTGDQETFYNTDAKAYLKAGGAEQLTWKQMETEMQIAGLLNSGVYDRDFAGAVEATAGEKFATFKDKAGKLYQVSDNGFKRHALAVEFNKHLAAAKDGDTVKEAWDRAVEDVRATTQNYDLVPKLLRQASQYGLFVPTFVSFNYELIRGIKNNVILAGRELKSGNPVLMANGFKRIAGLAGTGMLLYAATNAASQLFTGWSREEREKLEAAMEPWNENKEMLFTRADDKELAYFDPSYVIPYGLFYNAISAVGKDDAEVSEVLQEALVDMNIFTKTAADMVSNNDRQKGGRAIYNEEVDTPDVATTKLANYAYNNMMKPGVVRQWERAKKSVEGSIDYGGVKHNVGDFMLYMAGIRMIRKATDSPEFINDNLVEFAGRMREINSYLTKRQKAKASPEELATAEARMGVAEEKLKKDFDATIGMFRQLGISEDRINAGLKEAKIPKDLLK